MQDVLIIILENIKLQTHLQVFALLVILWTKLTNEIHIRGLE